jgi:hypothetical protein
VAVDRLPLVAAVNTDVAAVAIAAAVVIAIVVPVASRVALIIALRALR